MNHKRIILCGPTASGKTYIRDKFSNAGFKPDISYTSRPIRPGEVDGVDYHFISKNEFEKRIFEKYFYEWVKYGDYYYGTGLEEWNTCDIFIMETDGITHIKPDDRKSCLVIFINTPFRTRVKRMKERGWSDEKIEERSYIDSLKFKDFKNYDLEINTELMRRK